MIICEARSDHCCAIPAVPKHQHRALPSPVPPPHAIAQVSRSTFTNCHARDNHGGAIQFSYIYTPPIISECTFQNTRAAAEGGAIHATGGPGMRVSRGAGVGAA